MGRLAAFEPVGLHDALLQISLDMRQANKTISALVQREAQARRATAFCVLSA